MEWMQTVLLALIQGLTEFLPISSSAHLILPAQLLGWQDQGLAFDVAVHIGSLMAVIGYFRKDLWQIGCAWGTSLVGGKTTAESRLGWLLIAATIPAGVAGLLFDSYIEQHARSMLLIAATTIVFGILLGVADKCGLRKRAISEFKLPAALIIGCCQALALVPGTSRSGITITAALMLGFTRETAAKISFLMAIPVIVLSGGYKMLQLAQQPSVNWSPIVLGTLLSMLTAYLCIYIFLKWIDRVGMMPFVWYRLALGAVLLAVVFY